MSCFSYRTRQCTKRPCKYSLLLHSCIIRVHGGSSPGTFSLPVAVLFSGLFLMEDEHAQGSPSLLSKPTCPPHLSTGLAGGCLVLALSQESRKTLFFSTEENNHSSTRAHQECRHRRPFLPFAVANDNMMTYSTIQKAFLCN